MKEPNDYKEYERAKQRVQTLRGFYSNLIVFAVVMGALFLFNILREPHHLWSLWIGLFWGLVLVVQGVSIFSIRDSFLGSEWEKKTIEKILNKDKEKK